MLVPIQVRNVTCEVSPDPDEVDPVFSYGFFEKKQGRGINWKSPTNPP